MQQDSSSSGSLWPRRSHGDDGPTVHARADHHNTGGSVPCVLFKVARVRADGCRMKSGPLSRTSIVRDPWLWALLLCALPLVLHASRTSLGEPFADDFSFLRR